MGSSVFPQPSSGAPKPILRQTITSSSNSISIPSNISTVYAYLVGGGGGGGSSSGGGAAGQVFGKAIASTVAVVGTGGNSSVAGNATVFGGLVATGGGGGSGSTVGLPGNPGGTTNITRGTNNSGSGASGGTFNRVLTSDYSGNYGLGGSANSAGSSGVIYLYY
jgi:hypothetical protein